jgi:hypothetical protein
LNSDCCYLTSKGKLNWIASSDVSPFDWKSRDNYDNKIKSSVIATYLVHWKEYEKCSLEIIITFINMSRVENCKMP